MCVSVCALAIIKAGFRTCVSSARYLSIYRHPCSQAIPPFAIKVCDIGTKSHMLNFCEACAALCCEFDLWETDNAEHEKYFLFSEKKRAKLKTKNIATTFGKSLFLTKYLILTYLQIQKTSQ